MGERVVVVGGGRVGCETAELLAGMGKEVVIVEMLESLPTDMGKRQGKPMLLDLLAAREVAIRT